MSIATMLDAVRKALKDDRYNVLSMTVSCTDDAVTEALLEITAGRLVTTIVNGSTASLNISLTDPLYDTVGKLQNALDAMEGYSALPSQDMEEDDLSIELEPTGPMSIKPTGYDLKTRIFGNQELLDLLGRVTRRHNPSLTPDTLPVGEEPLVLALLQAEIFRILANDTVRRKNLDMTVDQLMQLAQQYEDIYAADMERLNRVLSPPKETTESVGSGDIMVGTFIRQSLRTGVAYPISAPLGQDCPIAFLSSAQQKAEDTIAEIRWTRKRPFDFRFMEIWRDTHSTVRRTSDQTKDPTTSKMVFTDRNMVNDSYRDDTLEPSTVYYYKVYLVDTTGEYVETETLSITTLAVRTKFGPDPVVTPTQGPAATSISIKLTTYANSTDTVVELGGKVLVGVWSAPNFTAPVPSFVQKGKKDLVVTTTPTGLRDIRVDAFEVT